MQRDSLLSLRFGQFRVTRANRAFLACQRPQLKLTSHSERHHVQLIDLSRSSFERMAKNSFIDLSLFFSSRSCLSSVSSFSCLVLSFFHVFLSRWGGAGVGPVLPGDDRHQPRCYVHPQRPRLLGLRHLESSPAEERRNRNERKRLGKDSN